MNLAIDVDGVLRNFVAALTRQYLSDFPEHEARVQPVTEWGIDKFFPLGNDIYRYAFETRVEAIFTTAPAYPGAKDFIDDLKAAGHKVFIVTTQKIGTEKYTVQWLHSHHIDNYDGLIFTAHKELVRCDYLLDDGPHNLDAFNLHGIAIAFDQPWNQKWEGCRARTYDEFRELIGDIEPELEPPDVEA
jgi:5'(3')-deoxyribonucleotidase